jgi:hypothetical protein
MPNSRDLKHIHIEAFSTRAKFSPPKKDLSEMGPTRSEKVHGAKLVSELADALRLSAANMTHRDQRWLTGQPGSYLEVEGMTDGKLPDLNWPSKNIRMGAVRVAPNGAEVGILFVPEDSESFLTKNVSEYALQKTPGNKPKHEQKFAPVEFIRAGSLLSLWTDPRPIPIDGKPIWWECWIWSDRSSNFLSTIKKLDIRASNRRLKFPELEVVPIFTNLQTIIRLIQNTDSIEQIRRASDSPSFFTRIERKNQTAWVDNLSPRISWPQTDNTAVVILDGGINRAHPLLGGALRPKDCLTVNEEWGADDHDLMGHGTNMAGTVLYADLTYPLSDQRKIFLDYRLVSVKFLPPPGFVLNDPAGYGAITQAAIAVAEINNPETQHVFCMAVTNDFSGERPSSWSAALDQICAGVMPGDSVDQQDALLRRLFFVSAGNIPDASDPGEVADLDEFPVLDPAQAWNAVAVGGFTDKVDVSVEDGLTDWVGLAAAGDHSPYSRISTDWNHSRTAIKPEIVFEAGNKAMNSSGTEILSGVDSLSLLTTNKDFLKEALTTFWATSAATAQAAGMAAELITKHPSYWPETIRALLVHSAEWTPRMKERIRACKGTKKDAIALSRQFGYGVPSLERALASAENDLALVAQASIQPFKRSQKETTRGGISLGNPTFNEVHYYSLPWPKSSLEALAEKNIQLKITLSYFIEPSPGEMAPVTPARYQSHGLRFEVKRAGETADVFKKRINRLERDAETLPPTEPDNRWLFGSNSISAGSLHCDVWTGPAAELAARGLIAVFPVSGWWRYRNKLKRLESKTRYSLIVSIVSDDIDVKLYTEIANLIQIRPEVETSV